MSCTVLSAQENPSPATIQGTVVDARTGAPLRRVLVSIDGDGTTETDDLGRFTLPVRATGTIRLYVSAVGYGLVQRTLPIGAGEVIELTLPLSEGASTYTETLTVAADRFREVEPGVPAQQTLGGAELQNLRGVVADDALRAVQVLPGVATGDDFRSEFSVRGSDFPHMNFMVDGFATPFLMHMVRAVEDRANTGSVAMVNSDVLEEVTLSSGGYPQRSGNRTGAELAFTVREGSRDRTIARASISGTSASFTGEGPIGRSKRGSWLVSGRKSYLDLLIDRLSDEGLSFGFADMQAKLRYDFTNRHSAALTIIAGDSRLRELPERAGPEDLFVGNNAAAIAIGTWRAVLPRGLLTAGVMGATNAFDNYDDGSVRLEEGTTDQLIARADVRLRVTPGVELESGVLGEYASEFQRRQRRVTGLTTTVINEYQADGIRVGAYAGARLGLGGATIVTPGMRVDRWDVTDQTTASPWVQAEIRLSPGVKIRAAGGVYQQFPDFEEVRGAFAGDNLLPEQAIHSDVGIEYRLSPSTRLQLTFYNRKDERMIQRPDADTRLVDGRLVRGALAAQHENRADGYARGVEVLVQRSSPGGLSGWLSYAYGRNRYEDQVSGESYWGDLDQRHTFNAYAFYRFSHRFSASAKLRMGSNFPIPGYYERFGDVYLVSSRRNTARLPKYARLDLRVNRTFDWPPRRLTLFVEVLNVLNRENVRFNPPRISSATQEVTRLFDSLVPVVPSAGLLFEF